MQRWWKLKWKWVSGIFFPMQVPYEARLPKHNCQDVFYKSSHDAVWTAVSRSSIWTHAPIHCFQVWFSKMCYAWSDQPFRSAIPFLALTPGCWCSGFPHGWDGSLRGHLLAWLQCPKLCWALPLLSALSGELQVSQSLFLVLVCLLFLLPGCCF